MARSPDTILDTWRRSGNGRLRARGLGLHFEGTPGTCNAITDVPGVTVGYTTLVSGEGPLYVGRGPIRTGVTGILPRERSKLDIPCHAASYSFNGAGEMSGLIWIEEAGQLEGPVAITNTNSCGVARDAITTWMVRNNHGSHRDFGLPVAGETYDGELNDINGQHVTAEHVMAALDNAGTGAIAMGNVGGGTGMITYDFKGGSSTASRRVVLDGETFTLGVFVQSNFGKREHLTMQGVPVGKMLDAPKLRWKDAGSIIVVVATDAPLLPHQLKRLARRVPLGLARTGTTGGHGSGDIFLALSTANADALASKALSTHFASLNFEAMEPLFEATVQATEEAVVDAMITGETMVGRDGNTSHALPHDALLDILRRDQS